MIPDPASCRYHPNMPSQPQQSPYLSRLGDSLVQTADDGRIGFPCFMRWLDRIATGESLDDSLNAGLDICNRLFGSKPKRVYRAGDKQSHATIQAVWTSGASAVISAGPVGRGAENTNTGPEIMLLGSSGAVYFDGAIGGSPTVSEIRP